MVPGFQANYFCRFCMCHKTECKVLTEEAPYKLRDIETYNRICARFHGSEDIDATESKGVKYYCQLNDLENFHIFENYSVDLMHDLLEGVVSFAIKHIFEYAIGKKLFNLQLLQNMIQFFNYGPLNKRNIPSKLKITSKNMGQNATQLYCLVLNLPFILVQFKKELEDVWILVETLLQILEIVFSEKITENDLNRLELLIKTHNEFYVNSSVDLLPKHHLLTHYARVIRQMGPVIFTNTMRCEAKHQQLKAIVRKANNFTNLNKTVSEKHQLIMCLKGGQFSDEIEIGMEIGEFKEYEEFEIFGINSEFVFTGDEILVKSAKVNSIMYKSDLLLAHEGKLFEISYILHRSGLDSLWFLCNNSFKVESRDKFSNSFVLIEDCNVPCVISYTQLMNKHSYQRIFSEGKIYVSCESLDFSKLLPL